MSGETHHHGAIHNYRNDYKYTFEMKQKANGEWQLGGKIRSDHEELVLPLFESLMTDFKKMCKAKGFPVVKKVGSDDI